MGSAALPHPSSPPAFDGVTLETYSVIPNLDKTRAFRPTRHSLARPAAHIPLRHRPIVSRMALSLAKSGVACGVAGVFCGLIRPPTRAEQLLQHPQPAGPHPGPAIARSMHTCCMISCAPCANLLRRALSADPLMPAAKPQRAARLVVRAEEAAAPAAPKAAPKKEVGPKRGSQVRCCYVCVARHRVAWCAQRLGSSARSLHYSHEPRMGRCRSRSCGQRVTGTTRPARSCPSTRLVCAASRVVVSRRLLIVARSGTGAVCVVLCSSCALLRATAPRAGLVARSQGSLCAGSALPARVHAPHPDTRSLMPTPHPHPPKRTTDNRAASCTPWWCALRTRTMRACRPTTLAWTRWSPPSDV
jgi:hypothetical protein